MFNKSYLPILTLFGLLLSLGGCEKAGEIAKTGEREAPQKEEPGAPSDSKLERQVARELDDALAAETEPAPDAGPLPGEQALREAVAKAVKNIDTSLLEATIPKQGGRELSSEGWDMKKGTVRKLTEEEARELGLDPQLSGGGEVRVQSFTIEGESAADVEDLLRNSNPGEGEVISKSIELSIDSENPDEIAKQLTDIIQKAIDETALRQLGVIEGAEGKKESIEE